jgi:hypothetical protein
MLASFDQGIHRVHGFGSPEKPKQFLEIRKSFPLTNLQISIQPYSIPKFSKKNPLKPSLSG